MSMILKAFLILFAISPVANAEIEADFDAGVTTQVCSPRWEGRPDAPPHCRRDRRWRRPRPQPAVCFARDFHGRTYRARGWNRRQTQRQALRRCFNNSYIPRSCRPIGCR